ncbi:MAG: hypothetical protein HXY34_01920 [Candidatus Thorarchaeota archaeon]|nr:hypothetical protein [Candidatus Thorarchaeota archaeon]
MSEIGYDDILRAWENEVREPDLQSLEDLRLGKMVQYLSKVRLMLTEVPAEDRLQADLLVSEIRNLDYMLRDLMVLRREKIVRAALAQRRPLGTMTLAEEDLYNRLSRGLAEHAEFLKDLLEGHMPQRPSDAAGSDDTEKIEYVVVRFLRPISTPFMGLDERTYGPFKKEDIASLPRENVQAWLRDGTAVRVAMEERSNR